MIESTATIAQLVTCRCCDDTLIVATSAPKNHICNLCLTKKIVCVNFPAYEIARKPYSTHKGDDYLEIVVAAIKDEEWVTWMYNASFDSMNGGHYFNSRRDAMADYAMRGVPSLPEGLNNYKVMVTLRVLALSLEDAYTTIHESIDTLDTSIEIISMRSDCNEL